MTKEEAILFLEKHQPMPEDNELSESIINKYDEVRSYFENNPDEQCIPLFMNSFGGKDGLGVYQMIEFIILMYEQEKVLPHIVEALQSPYEGVKYWAAQIAADFPDDILFEPLIKLVKSEDEDIKVAAITALAQLALQNICVTDVVKVLEDEIERMSDVEIKEFVEEVLEDIRN